MKRQTIKNLLLLITMTIMITACIPTKMGKADDNKTPDFNALLAETQVDESFNIKTATVERGNISSKLMLSGDVKAFASVDVYPEASGELTRINVKVGDQVVKDQVIAKIDPSRPGMKYTESPVEAPINGTITAVNADLGATVGLQMPLLTIGDISQLIITTKIPERYIYMVEKGQTASITTTAAPGKEYKAEVSSIAPVLNPVSRTLSIELKIIGNTPIKAGMFVGIELRTSISNNSLIIPERAVLSRDEGKYVFLVNGDKVEKVNVKTGIRDEGLVEVTEGLSEGDLIATDGVTLLSDGVKVKIVSGGEKK